MADFENIQYNIYGFMDDLEVVSSKILNSSGAVHFILTAI
jgi:hypothetical protein